MTTEQEQATADTKELATCPQCGNDRAVIIEGMVGQCGRCGKTWTVPGMEHIVDAQPKDAEVEVLDPGERPPSTELATRDDPPEESTRSALERAAEVAITTPGIPGRDEFLSLAMQARILSLSGAAPRAIRNNPHVAFHVAMVGRDMELSPTAALQLVDVIGTPDTDDCQISLSPQLLTARIAKLGLGKVELLREPTYTTATAVALRPGGYIKRDVDGQPIEIAGEIGRSTFTWDDAKIAGLVDLRCADAMHHWRKEGGDSRRRDTRCRCRQGWRTYPKRMLGWRAQGYCADDYFPEASLGLYSPEELGAVVDEEGRPIDPATVALPEGYEGGSAPADAGTEQASEEEKDALRARLQALPPDVLQRAREKWAQYQAEERMHALAHLTKRELPFADAMVSAFETEAKRAARQANAEAAPATPDGPAPAETDTATAPAGDGPGEDQTAEYVAAQAEVQALDEYERGLARRAEEAVSRMTARVVNASLRERGLAVARDGAENKRRLARSLVDDYRDADQRAAASQHTDDEEGE